MQIRIEQWALNRFLRLKEKINPKPQFQRGEVWKESRKQLFIDSILRGYDFPKIYLSTNNSNLHYDYDVADGQQRLRAVWEYCNDAYPTADNARPVRGHTIAGLRFSQLPPKLRSSLEKFKTTVAIITGMPQHELRALFARLQMGVILTPPELRNAIASALGAVIHTAAETHQFFVGSKISKARFKRQDFLAHALALAYYDNSQDLKAGLLMQLYDDQAISYDKQMVRKAYDVLDWMLEINREANHYINKKWGFVDVFWFLYQEHGSIKSIDSKGFGDAYVAFEDERIKHANTPEYFLRRKKYLYGYIQAFNTSGSVTDRLTTRNKVIRTVFSKFLKV